MAEDIPWAFIGAIIGGGISGGIGILVMWYSLRSRSKDELRDSVYVPLYNSITNLKLEPIFDDYVEDKWARLESHKKLRVDKKIKELYQKYEKLGKEHHHLLVEWNNEFDKKHRDFARLIRDTFDTIEILMQGEIPVTHSYNVQVESFVNWFRHILFDNTIKDSQELYEKLLSYANKRQRDFEGWFKKIHDEKPQCYELLLGTVKEIEKTFPESIDYLKLIEKRNELKSLIIEITGELEKRVTN